MAKNAALQKKSMPVLMAGIIAVVGLQESKGAHIDQVRNSVKSGKAGVKAGTALAPGSTVSTGSKSRTQLSLGVNGSLARAGSKTDLVLQNDASLSLRQGVMLASSGKKGIGREAVSVDTPEIASTVKGTMLVAYQPGVFIKITCIEGAVTVKLKALMGEFVKLKEGQMVIINPASRDLPQEVEVDLRELRATSALLGADFPGLASSPGMERAANRQAQGIGAGEVRRTPLLLKGAGLEVSIQTNTGIEPQRAQNPPRPASPRALAALRRVLRNRNNPGVIKPEYVIDGSTVFSRTNTGQSLQTPGFRQVDSSQRAGDFPATVWRFPDGISRDTPELLFRGQTEIPASPTGVPNEFTTDGNLAIGNGEPTRIMWNGDLAFTAKDGLGVFSSHIGPGSADNSTAGSNSSTNLLFGAGNQLLVRSSGIAHHSGITFAAPTVSIADTVVQSGSGGSAEGHGIRVFSSGNSPANGSIIIKDSSNLHALSALSFIALETNGAPISVFDSRLQAREINLGTQNNSADGLIAIRNSVLNGDVIRATAFNTGDRDALLINGSTFNATELIQFYAEGASKLRFQGETRLNFTSASGGLANLAGRTLQVDPGGNVLVNGNANVYRDVDNYNKPGYGNITVSGHQTHQPFAARPAR